MDSEWEEFHDTEEYERVLEKYEEQFPDDEPEHLWWDYSIKNYNAMKHALATNHPIREERRKDWQAQYDYWLGKYKQRFSTGAPGSLGWDRSKNDIRAMMEALRSGTPIPQPKFDDWTQEYDYWLNKYNGVFPSDGPAYLGWDKNPDDIEAMKKALKTGKPIKDTNPPDAVY